LTYLLARHDEVREVGGVEIANDDRGKGDWDGELHRQKPLPYIQETGAGKYYHKKVAIVMGGFNLVAPQRPKATSDWLTPESHANEHRLAQSSAVPT